MHHAFLQLPRPEGTSEDPPTWFMSLKANSREDKKAMEREDNKWAEKKLHIDGEDLVSKVRCPYNLLLARTILVEPLRLKSLVEDQMHALSGIESEGLAPETSSVQIGDYNVDVEEVESWESDPKTVVDALAKLMPSWFWWLGRCVITHQEFLSSRSGSLRVEIVGAAEQLELAGISGMCFLERGLWELMYGQIEAASKLIDRAEESVGVKASTTGAMGKRTVHQASPKAQLTLKFERNSTVCSMQEIQYLMRVSWKEPLENYKVQLILYENSGKIIKGVINPIGSIRSTWSS